MATKEYTAFTNSYENWTYDPIKVAIANDVIKLRPHDSAGAYRYNGAYETSEIEFSNLRIDALIKFYGIKIEGIIPENTDVKFQISTDQGANYYYYDTNTSSWIISPTDFNTVDDFNSGVDNLVLQSKNIRLKCKIETNGAGDATPILYAIYVDYEVRYNVQEDLKRSLKYYLKNNLRPIYKQGMIPALATSLIDFDPEDFEVKEIIAVYNISNDPDRLNNIFSVYAGGQITLTQIVPANDTIEIVYEFLPKIILSVDHDFEETVLPRIVINCSNSTENFIFTSVAETYEVYKDKILGRVEPIMKDIMVDIFSLAAHEVEEYAIAGAIDELLQYNTKIDSLASGLPINIVKYDPMDNLDVVSMGLQTSKSRFIAAVQEHRRSVKVYDKVQRVVVK